MFKHAAIGCLITAWIAAIAVGAGHLAGLAWPIAWAMAAFLAFFGLGKGLMGVEKLIALRAVGRGGVDPRRSSPIPSSFGSSSFLNYLLGR